MKSKAKLTLEQMTAIYGFIQRFKDKDSGKKEVKFWYNAETPKDVYVSYNYSEILDDNSIKSEVIVKRISPNGNQTDLDQEFPELKSRLQFEYDLQEIDFDANGKIILL